MHEEEKFNTYNTILCPKNNVHAEAIKLQEREKEVTLNSADLFDFYITDIT